MSISITYEKPGVVVSTLNGTNIFNFTDIANKGAGKYEKLKWTINDKKEEDCEEDLVGIIDQVYLQKADQYGGAKFPVGYYPVQSLSVGGVNRVPETCITFSRACRYFGFWWSAGDAYNTITFSRKGKEIVTFNARQVLNKLSQEYHGNMLDYRADKGEPFAFLNFFADSNEVAFDQIKFSNPSSGTGFESDNWTVREVGYGEHCEYGEHDSKEDCKHLPGKELLKLYTHDHWACFTESTQFQVSALTEPIKTKKSVKDLIVGEDSILCGDGKMYLIKNKYVLYSRDPNVVRFERGCFGENVPDEPLIVTPTHYLRLEDSQILSARLINKGTEQVLHGEVFLYHLHVDADYNYHFAYANNQLCDVWGNKNPHLLEFQMFAEHK